MEWFLIPMCMVVAFLLGAMTGKNIEPTNVSGFIVVDTSNEDGPYMFLEINEPINDFCERTSATVGVIVRGNSR